MDEDLGRGRSMSAAGTPVTDEAYVGLAGSGTAAASLVWSGVCAEGLWLVRFFSMLTLWVSSKKEVAWSPDLLAVVNFRSWLQQDGGGSYTSHASQLHNLLHIWAQMHVAEWWTLNKAMLFCRSNLQLNKPLYVHVYSRISDILQYWVIV